MHLLTSLLLTGLIVTGVMPLTTDAASQHSLNTVDQPTYLAQKRGQSKHRGSGRIEFVSFVDAHIS